MHSAPAKIILFGEHAVVYGQPAIAVPFTALSATAEALPSPSGTGLSILAHDVHRVLHVPPETLNDDPPDNALTYAGQLTLHTLYEQHKLSAQDTPTLAVHIRSTIPVASGFGSGAAVTTALIRELSAVLGAPLEGEALNKLVYEVEKMHHGTPSGIDNTVIVFNQPIYFVREQPPELFTTGQPFTLVVADSGVPGSTRETVGAVRMLYEGDQARYQAYFDQIGALVRDARSHLERGEPEALGKNMTDNQALLRLLTVSSDTLDKLVDAAMGAGALGAKLSGGGRGGNVIALVNPADAERVAAALWEAGAARTWITTLDAARIANGD